MRFVYLLYVGYIRYPTSKLHFKNCGCSSFQSKPDYRGRKQSYL